MSLYLYAVTSRRPRRLPDTGILGEPLAVVSTRRLHAIVGRTDRSPIVDRQTLSAQDGVIAELSQGSTAILPARFGSRFPDNAAVVTRLNELEPELSKALDEVRGREQMVLRVFTTSRKVGLQSHRSGLQSHRAGKTPRTGTPSRAGTGAAYMHDRVRRARDPLPELRSVLPALESLVEAERIVRHETAALGEARAESKGAPLVATVYHLIERGRAGEYADAVRTAAGRVRGLRVTVSGPFAPYAFAPDPCR